VQQDGVDALAKDGTATTLLPGAFYFLGETKNHQLLFYVKQAFPWLFLPIAILAQALPP